MEQAAIERNTSPSLYERLDVIAPRLECWWEHGDQKNPCLTISTLSEPAKMIIDTDDLGEYWTDVDFIIKRQLAIIANTSYYGQAIPYHYVDHGSAAMAFSNSAAALR
jgi:hypothetical protein